MPGLTLGVPTVLLVGCLTLASCSPDPHLGQAPLPSPTASGSASPTVTGTRPTPSESAGARPTARPTPDVQFAVIGDFGSGGPSEEAVARMVASWKPSFIVGLGDQYYAQAGGDGTSRYDNSVGAHYCAWLKDISTTGNKCPQGKAKKNAFFPTLGNHDLTDALPAPGSYLDYFKLPGSDYSSSSGNERYYDFVEGPLHFFVLNSNPSEPDGTTQGSTQAKWLKTQLAKSTAQWKIVVDHHPPYSSDSSHGSTESMRWPFAAWGADAVLSGHSHTYERVMQDGIVYFVNGLGGAGLYQFGSTAVEGSAVRFAADWGAQSVSVSRDTLRFDFYDVSGRLIDSYSVNKR